MNKKNPDILHTSVPVIYFFIGSVIVILTQLFFLLHTELFFNPPLTGSLIVWTHLHTMGVITPAFMGAGWWSLMKIYQARINEKLILVHSALHFSALFSFLFFVHNRQGSSGLNLSALVLFLSGMIFLWVYARNLFKSTKGKKDKRDFTWWLDLISLFFLLQVVTFGLVLALNLSHGFLRRQEIHSLRLHSHSGITGFWMLQFLLYFFRSNSDIEVSRFWAKVSGFSMALGLFLWTSVHDRFKGVFYLYLALSLVSIFSLFMFYLKSQFENKIKKEIYFNSLIFMIFAFVTAVVLVFYDENFIYEKRIPVIYAFCIFYGIFLFFFGAVFSNYLQFNEDIQSKFIWVYRIFLKLLILSAVFIYTGSGLYLTLALSGVLVMTTYGYFLTFKSLRQV